MKIHQATLSVKTTARVIVENVTGLVTREVSSSGIREGFALLTTPHTTCGLVVNEDEPGLVHDIERLATSLLEPLAAARPFEHDRIDDNARAHLTSMLFGRSVHLPVTDSTPTLGRWQSVLLVEMDGPRSRSLTLQVIGL